MSKSNFKPRNIEHPKTGKRVHTTPETAHTRCDMCPELDCIEQERSRIHRWRYYCDAMHAQVDVYKVTKRECPLHRELRKRRFKSCESI